MSGLDRNCDRSVILNVRIGDRGSIKVGSLRRVEFVVACLTRCWFGRQENIGVARICRYEGSAIHRPPLANLNVLSAWGQATDTAGQTSVVGVIRVILSSALAA